MSRLWVLAASTALIALAFVACSGSGSRSGSPSGTQSAAGDGGEGAVGGGAALAGGGAGLGGGAGPAKAGGGGQAAGESPGGSATGGSAGMGGNGNVSGSDGAQTNGGTGWIVPAEPGAGWSGPQDAACPSAAVSANADCTSPPGTRCSYPEPGGTYTLRCQCYTSSTGADRWWYDHHASIGYDPTPLLCVASNWHRSWSVPASMRLWRSRADDEPGPRLR